MLPLGDYSSLTDLLITILLNIQQMETKKTLWSVVLLLQTTLHPAKICYAES